jgi:hypothetical protein
VLHGGNLRADSQRQRLANKPAAHPHPMTACNINLDTVIGDGRNEALFPGKG